MNNKNYFPKRENMRIKGGGYNTHSQLLFFENVRSQVEIKYTFMISVGNLGTDRQGSCEWKVIEKEELLIIFYMFRYL